MLDDRTLRYDEYLICMLDRLEAVCDRDDDRCILESCKCFADISLALYIECRCRLVEDDEIIRTDKNTSKSKSLLLATREIDSSLPYLYLETLWSIDSSIEKVAMSPPKSSQEIRRRRCLHHTKDKIVLYAPVVDDRRL